MDIATNHLLKRTILKYHLDWRTTLMLPTPYPEGTVKHFDIYADRPTIWVEVVTDSVRAAKRHFQIFGTGVPVVGSYVATCFDRRYVWHLYELGESEAAKWPTD